MSIAQLGAAICDNGPNSATSTRDHAVCPAKVGVVVGGRLVMSRSIGKLCAETINDGGARQGAPDWKDPALWGTQARYDGRAHTIELHTLQNKRVERAGERAAHVVHRVTRVM